MVYGPDSVHSPTVTVGQALILYLLPDGAIDFTPGGSGMEGGGGLPKGVTGASLRINGRCAPWRSDPSHAARVLREAFGLTGTKHGCELGECGACAVLIDGEAVLSCLQLAAEVRERSIETVEGLQVGNALHPLQAALPISARRSAVTARRGS